MHFAVGGSRENSHALYTTLRSSDPQTYMPIKRGDITVHNETVCPLKPSRVATFKIWALFSSYKPSVHCFLSTEGVGEDGILIACFRVAGDSWLWPKSKRWLAKGVCSGVPETGVCGGGEGRRV